MTEHSPFDHTHDPALGVALREVLAVGDDAVFVHRVLERVRVAEPWWAVLGEWARPGVAAALLLVAVGGFLLGRLVGPAPGAVATGEAVRAVAGLEVSALLGDAAPPDLEAILGDVSQH
jgi:hypothetical protein